MAKAMMARIHRPRNIGLAVISSVASKWKMSVRSQSMLANDKRSTIEVATAFDADGTYLETSDDLPLFTVNKSPNLLGVSVTKAGEKSLDVLEDTGTGVHRFRISNVDQMMAFDCGEFELK